MHLRNILPGLILLVTVDYMGIEFQFLKGGRVLAAFLNGFIFILSGYLLTNFKDKNNLSKALSILFNNFIYYLCSFSRRKIKYLQTFIRNIIFFSINKYFKTKTKVYFIFIISVVTLFAINSSDYFKGRYYYQIKNLLITEGATKSLLNLYKSGYEVFKKYPF